MIYLNTSLQEYINIPDMIWMEALKPNYKIANRFAEESEVFHPNISCRITCSPGLASEELITQSKIFVALVRILVNWGYVWQVK